MMRGHTQATIRTALIAIGIGLCRVGAAGAVPVVDPGAHLLQAAPGQSIQVLAFDDAGTTSIQGLNFRAQIGDGGDFLQGSGNGDPASLLTLVDLINGTVFATNNTGQMGSRQDLIVNFQTTTNVGTIDLTTTSVPIATLEFDGTGLAGRSFDIILGGISLPGGTVLATDFGGIPATTRAGSITFVPEPGTASLLFSGLLALGLARLSRASFAAG